MRCKIVKTREVILRQYITTSHELENRVNNQVSDSEKQQALFAARYGRHCRCATQQTMSAALHYSQYLLYDTVDSAG